MFNTSHHSSERRPTLSGNWHVLKTPGLMVKCDSLTIGDAQRQVLHDKRDELEEKLLRERAALEGQLVVDFPDAKGLGAAEQLENEAADFGNDGGSEVAGGQKSSSSEFTVAKAAYQVKLDQMCSEYQKHIDQLYRRFKNDWIENKHKTRQHQGSRTYPESDESYYLASNLGDILSIALADVCEKRPRDPIEHLAEYLKHYSANLIWKKEDRVTALKVQLAQEDAATKAATKVWLRKEQQQIHEENKQRLEMYERRQLEAEQSDSTKHPGGRGSPVSPVVKVIIESPHSDTTNAGTQSSTGSDEDTKSKLEVNPSVSASHGEHTTEDSPRSTLNVNSHVTEDGRVILATDESDPVIEKVMQEEVSPKEDEETPPEVPLKEAQSEVGENRQELLYTIAEQKDENNDTKDI